MATDARRGRSSNNISVFKENPALKTFCSNILSKVNKMQNSTINLPELNDNTTYNTENGEYQPKTVEALLQELDADPNDPVPQGSSSPTKLISLLDLPPVKWPEQVPRGSVMDDTTNYDYSTAKPKRSKSFLSKSAPFGKKSLLGRPGENQEQKKSILKGDFDLSDPHIQAMVQKQIEMSNANKFTENDNKPSTSQATSSKSQYSKKPSRWDKPSTSKWVHDDPFLQSGKPLYQSDSQASSPLFIARSQPSSSLKVPTYDIKTKRGYFFNNGGESWVKPFIAPHSSSLNANGNSSQEFGKSVPVINRGGGGNFFNLDGYSTGGNHGHPSSSISSDAIEYVPAEEIPESLINNEGLPRKFGKRQDDAYEYRKGRGHFRSSYKTNNRYGRKNEGFSSSHYDRNFSRSPPYRRSPLPSSSRSRSPIRSRSASRSPIGYSDPYSG